MDGHCESKNMNSDFLYNEYAIYDIAQVKMCYLLKVNFEFIFE